jgi:hypothetical protein
MPVSFSPARVVRSFAILFISALSTVSMFGQASWNPIVTVGPGYVDDYARQVVRTSSGVVYIVTNASLWPEQSGASSLRMYKGSPAGTPTTFTEVDASHRPSNNVRFAGVEAKMSDHLIKMAYEDDESLQEKYITFDTQTDTWGTPEIISSIPSSNTNRFMSTTALALDANGKPHVFYGGVGQGILYRNKVGATWSAPVVISSADFDKHPSISFDRLGNLHVAFYDPGTTYAILYRFRNTSGTWSSIETVASSDVDEHSLDQGPSLVIDSQNRPLVAYAGALPGEVYKLKRRLGANNWADISPPTQVDGHAPGLYIATNDDIYAFEGHDLQNIQPAVIVRSNATNTWGTYTFLAQGPPTRDGSSSSRWDLLWPGSTTDIDTTSVDETGGPYATTYYIHGTLASQGPDTTSPTVSVTNPTQGSTVSGTVTLSATATDNVGVVGVQFIVDGSNFGAELTTAPYTRSWDTSGLPTGQHTIAARARDAAGNSSTSATIAVNVTTQNPGDTTSPTVSLTSPTAGSTVSGTTSVAANASDNVGVAGVQFLLDGANLGTEDTTAPFSMSWDTTGVPNGTHVLSARARDAAGNSATATNVSVTVSNTVVPPPANLVAAYGFNENTGSTTADLSGNNNTGTLRAATWVTNGKFGNALQFDGSTSWVSVPDSASLDLTNGMTIEAWVNPSSVPAGKWQNVIMKVQPGEMIYALYANQGNNRPGGYVYVGSAENAAIGTAQLAANTWTHLASTYDGNTLRTFVNGTEVGSKVVGGNIVVSSGNLFIGGNSVWDENFVGLIDEVRIYNRALTVSQIQQDMTTAVGTRSGDTQAPTASVTSPTSGATVSGNVTVQANASDNVAVAGVQFLLDGANLGLEDTTAPYSITWDSSTASPGTHTLSARARDAAGNLGTAQNVSVTVAPPPDTQSPSVSVTSPAAGSSVSGTINVTASASDNVGVVGVQFLLDGANLGAEDTSAPYSVAWNTTTASSGNHVLSARARDAAGNVGTAQNVSVTVPPPADTVSPGVSVTAPAANSTVSGSVSVTATASDNVGVAGVQFLLDGNNLGAEDISSPYSVTWDTTAASNGSHVLSARARDTSGNIGNAANVTVNVNNIPPGAGLVAAYGFNEASGTSVLDSSGNANNGTITGATRVTTGRFGGALSFANSDWVTVPDSPSLDLSNGITIEAWVNPANINNGRWQTVVMKEGTTDLAYSLYLNQGNNVPGGFVFTNAESAVVGAVSLPLNTWTHLATTFDGSTQRLYVNGALVATKGIAGASPSTSNPLRIGGNSMWDEFAHGMIDEVRIYNRALSQAEIQGDMSTPVR